jgi:hypothetical protein
MSVRAELCRWSNALNLSMGMNAKRISVMRSLMQPGWLRAGRVLVAIVVGPGLTALLSSCTVVKTTAEMPVKAVTAVVPGSKTVVADPAALQTQVLRFADEFSLRTATALDEYARNVNTPDVRRQTLRWRLSLDTVALGIATGSNPTAGLLDFLALNVMMRSFLEERAAQVTPPGAMDSWLQSARLLESNAWSLAESVFTPAQLEEIRGAIQQTQEARAVALSSLYDRPQQFLTLTRQVGKEKRSSGSVFSLVGLDPTVGLDPAIREVTRTRLFAERAMFTAQRMPNLLRLQGELLTAETLQLEQVTNALASAERLSLAAAELPERLTSERKAILEELNVQETKLRGLVTEVNQSLKSGEEMSTSLNTTLQTFDALMKRFGVGEPDTAPPDTNAPPFNILDYAETAREVAAMAQQLDLLIKDAGSTLDSPALERRIKDLNALSDRAKADAKSVLNHAFLLGVALVVVVFGAALVYRRLVSPPSRVASGDAGKR